MCSLDYEPYQRFRLLNQATSSLLELACLIHTFMCSGTFVSYLDNYYELIVEKATPNYKPLVGMVVPKLPIQRVFFVIHEKAQVSLC